MPNEAKDKTRTLRSEELDGDEEYDDWSDENCELNFVALYGVDPQDLEFVP